MKKNKKLFSLFTILAIIIMLAVPFSASAATLRQNGNFWYCIGYVDGEVFTVDGGTAYCVNPLVPVPPNGNYTETQVNNDNLLKVLYYGYGGKGFNDTTKAKMNGYHNNNNITAYGNDLYYALTHRCAAKAYGSNYKFPTFDDWNYAIDSMYSYFVSQPKPSGCKAFVINANNYGSQTIAYIVHDKEILLQIHKRSADPKISDNNECYSLKGAVYGVYTDAACTHKLGEITTNDNGFANYPKRVSPDKTYYAKEIKAPKGFALSNEILQFKDVGNISQTTGLNIYMAYPYDKPQNDPVGILLVKEGNDGKKLAGAEFTVKHYPAEGTETNLKPRTWIVKTDKDGIARLDSKYLVSGDEFYMTTTGNPCLPLGVVTIVETKAPIGYDKDETVYSFKITGDGSESAFVDTFNPPTIKDNDFYVVLSKVDEKGQVLAGAEVELLDIQGTVVDKWTTTTENHEVHGLVPGNSYVYHEVKAPAGYVTAEDIPFVFDGTKNQFFEMVDLKTETYITKTDITGETEISGAQMVLTDSSGNVIEEWTSTTSAHLIKGLVAGQKYTITETVAPDGYAITTPIEFTVNPDGSPTYVSVKNKLTETYISKTDITGQKEIPGAEMELTEKGGKFIEKWTSTTTAHLIKGLVAGKTYVLTEKVAPDGYAITTPIEFTVNADGSPTYVKVVNSQTLTVISKTDITGDVELEGAGLKVVDKNNKVVDEWTSTKEAHKIEGLVAGEKYTLIETIAPKGYFITNSIEFTVKKDGTVNKVVMKDDLTTTAVSKKSITGKDELPGATLQILDENDKVIEEWVSTNEPHIVRGLVTGKTYKIVEVAAPDGYSIATPDEFTVIDDGNNTTFIVEVFNSLTVTNVTKTDMSGQKELSGASLKVVDEDGNTVDEWVSGETSHKIEGLTAGKTYKLIETISPDGYTTSEEVEFTVNSDGSVTEVTMKDDVTRYQFIKVDDEKKPVKGAKLQLLDEKGNVVEEWTTDGTPHVIEGKLIVGKKYTLHEVEAPEGYEKAEDYTFEVKNTSEMQTITMVDTYNGNVRISTPDQPVTPGNNYNSNFIQTGQPFPYIIAGIVVFAGLMIVLFRKRKENY